MGKDWKNTSHSSPVKTHGQRLEKLKYQVQHRQYNQSTDQCASLNTRYVTNYSLKPSIKALHGKVTTRQLKKWGNDIFCPNF